MFRVMASDVGNVFYSVFRMPWLWSEEAISNGFCVSILEAIVDTWVSQYLGVWLTVAIETIYISVQALIYCLLLYSMIGFEWKLGKFLLFYYLFLMCFIYFTFFGMMVVAMTPNHHIASVFVLFFISLWNLFAGFLIPRPLIPIWWRWYYWASHVAWTIYGLVASQVGDKDVEIEIPGFGNAALRMVLKQRFGYNYDFIPAVVAAHVVWVLIFFFVFACGIKFFNFQRR
uniref:ABC-2 type transporter transmembrane domain-containing protein n=1 Tax=Cucumis sativus TaxID=3659 RepID=A0A0A0KR02_CUCSA